jgi:hypothetical protein
MSTSDSRQCNDEIPLPSIIVRVQDIEAVIALGEFGNGPKVSDHCNALSDVAQTVTTLQEAGQATRRTAATLKSIPNKQVQNNIPNKRVNSMNDMVHVLMG